jgi:hypothetical protein
MRRAVANRRREHEGAGDTIQIVGTNSGQASTATVVCEFNAQTNTLTFTITNTSAITSPGSTSTITGIGYDLPPLGNASASGLNGFTGTQAPSLSSTFNFSDAISATCRQVSTMSCSISGLRLDLEAPSLEVL